MELLGLCTWNPPRESHHQALYSVPWIPTTLGMPIKCWMSNEFFKTSSCQNFWVKPGINNVYNIIYIYYIYIYIYILHKLYTYKNICMQSLFDKFLHSTTDVWLGSKCVYILLIKIQKMYKGRIISNDVNKPMRIKFVPVFVFTLIFHYLIKTLSIIS